MGARGYAVVVTSLMGAVFLVALFVAGWRSVQ